MDALPRTRNLTPEIEQMATVPSLAKQWDARRIRHLHDHPPVRNANLLHVQELGYGDRLADRFTQMVGSWSFLIIQSLFLAAWIAVNAVGYLAHWDPYPFILICANLTMLNSGMLIAEVKRRWRRLNGRTGK
jgi:uncharacterized membrane protein